MFKGANKSLGISYIIVAILTFALMGKIQISGYVNFVVALLAVLYICVQSVYIKKGKRAMESGMCDFNLEKLNEIKASLENKNAGIKSASKKSKNKKHKKAKGKSSLTFGGGKSLSYFFILMCAILFFASYFFTQESVLVMLNSQKYNVAEVKKLIAEIFFVSALVLIVPRIIFRKKRLQDCLPFSIKLSPIEMGILATTRVSLFFATAIYSLLITINKVSANVEIVFTMMLGIVMIHALPFFAIAISNKRKS